MNGVPAGGLGSIGTPGVVAAGIRAQPTVAPVPNNVPAGAQTGAPPRTQLYSRLVIPAGKGQATLLVPPTPENRVVAVRPPNTAFALYVGDQSVNPASGFAVPTIGEDIPLPGLQGLWAVTDAPTYVRVNVYVSIVLMAEQARPVGEIGNEPSWRPSNP